jgi:hypothetical protein
MSRIDWGKVWTPLFSISAATLNASSGFENREIALLMAAL